MKTLKTLILLTCLFINKSGNSQIIDDTLTHTDSINLQKIDTIYAIKTNYIGQPISKLFADLSDSIDFSMPDDLGGDRRRPSAYYKRVIVYLPGGEHDISCGFFVTLTNKFYISLPEYNKKIRTGEWSSYLKTLMGGSIVANLEKHN
jgi:hypothetical protein